jgi:type II secretory pathway pseudopilin PulG
MVCAPNSRAPRGRFRPGFTLIELLIVTMIMIALVGLTLGATFHVLAGQRKSNSLQTAQTVSRALDRQWKAAIDMSKTEPVPDGVSLLAVDNNGQNKPRAQVIWTKLVLKREFPMTFQEALVPINLPTYNLTTATVPPSPTYVRALSTVGPTHQASTEPAALLYLALRQARRGETFDTASLGSAAIRDTDGDGLQELVDAWGTPLSFYRFPTGFAEFQGVPNRIRDPMDPQGLLLDPAWLTFNSGANRIAFESQFHPVMNANGSSFYLAPVVASAGPNLRMGLDYFMNATNPQSDANDNIYGFRRFGDRGD